MAAAAACPRTCRTIQVMPVLFVFQFALQCWCFYLPVVDMTTRSHKDTRMDLWLREVSCPGKHNMFHLFLYLCLSVDSCTRRKMGC